MLIYLASPYSHLDAAVRQARYEAVVEYAAAAADAGHCVQSPIAHWHPVAVKHGLPTDAEFWKFVNAQLLRHCTELWVLCLPGWDESIGVSWEVGLAEQLYIPVRFVKPTDPIDPREKP